MPPSSTNTNTRFKTIFEMHTNITQAEVRVSMQANVPSVASGMPSSAGLGREAFPLVSVAASNSVHGAQTDPKVAECVILGTPYLTGAPSKLLLLGNHHFSCVSVTPS